jgi:hypothetical protein
MTRRSKILLVRVMSVIAVAVAIAAIEFFQFTRNLNRRIVNLTDDQARVMLNNELPRGTNKFQVKQFLDAKKWPYSDNGSMVQTMIHDAGHNGLIRTDIQIKFWFDSEDKLISYEINDIHTGP